MVETSYLHEVKALWVHSAEFNEPVLALTIHDTVVGSSAFVKELVPLNTAQSIPRAFDSIMAGAEALGALKPGFLRSLPLALYKAMSLHRTGVARFIWSSSEWGWVHAEEVERAG